MMFSDVTPDWINTDVVHTLSIGRFYSGTKRVVGDKGVVVIYPSRCMFLVSVGVILISLIFSGILFSCKIEEDGNFLGVLRILVYIMSVFPLLISVYVALSVMEFVSIDGEAVIFGYSFLGVKFFETKINTHDVVGFLITKIYRPAWGDDGGGLSYQVSAVLSSGKVKKLLFEDGDLGLCETFSVLMTAQKKDVWFFEGEKHE